MIDLRCGDCLEILRTMPDNSVDAVITDPPYLEGDFSHFLQEFKRVAKRVVLTPGKLESFNWIAREKPFWEYIWKCSGTSSLGGSACLHILVEPILAYHPPLIPLGSDLLDFPLVVDPLAKGHPWPKPLGLFKKIVSHWTKPDQWILDPFMGAGTTGKACVQLGRNFIGIEISPEYFAIAQKRIAQAQLQPALPIEIPQPTQAELFGAER